MGQKAVLLSHLHGHPLGAVPVLADQVDAKGLSRHIGGCRMKGYVEDAATEKRK
jgi:hypothetical protein